MTAEPTNEPEPFTNGGSRTGGLDPRAVAGDLAAQAPAAMSSAVDAAAGAINESALRIQTSSDEVLAIGTALSTGIAIGLILGGANRLLVGASLIPSAAMGFTLLSRYTEVRPRTGTNGGSTRKAG
jgi:hypothetical protein